MCYREREYCLRKKVAPCSGCPLLSKQHRQWQARERRQVGSIHSLISPSISVDVIDPLSGVGLLRAAQIMQNCRDLRLCFLSYKPDWETISHEHEGR